MNERTTKRFQAGDVGQAARVLRTGGLLAFPTETVYGLGAHALNAEAVAGIYAAKERPGWDPVIVHVCDRKMAGLVVAASDEAENLMEAFWPGPLTLLLPKTAIVPDGVTAGRKLVGVRMPGHDLALDLIRLAGVPVAAPSANRFGRTSPTTAEHVLRDLDGRIDGVLDGGPTSVGVESTVFDVAARVVYRPGAVSVEQLSSMLGEEVCLFGGVVESASAGVPSPGVSLRHYAPRARLVLIDETAPVIGGMMDSVIDELRPTVGVMLPTGWEDRSDTVSFDWGRWEDLEMLAKRLFAGLRALDEAEVHTIVCPVPRGGGIGIALRDRLEKAARVE